ncbi:hypothetical protein M0R04_07610 [Candidatus Dojkabacteria bacterium]|jgi:hypothetical protein|nr:hypothetical protein [Candidatus Dojkabacteria bacterium]
MAHLVSIKVGEDDYEGFWVSEEVFKYIRQLETYIKHPTKSNLKQQYPERFPEVSE